MNVCLLITYFSTNNSIIITKREICNFLSQLSLTPAISSQHTGTKTQQLLIAIFWKSSRKFRNFRPQLSQKRPAKSWGDCIVKWWAHVMSLGQYQAITRAIRGALSIFHGPLVE